MLSDRIVASLESVTMNDTQKQAVLERVLERADAARAAEADVQTKDWAMERPAPRRGRAGGAHKKRRAFHRSLRWLVPTAAVLILLITVCSVPAVSKAIRDWFYDAFRVDRYLDVPAEERTPNAEFDAAITAAVALEQTNEVLLLSETEEYARIDAARREQGIPAYDPNDWAWLKDSKPVVTDLYYDGADFMVMTFLPCDPLPFMNGFFEEDLSPMRLDVLSLDDATLTNLATGQVQEMYPSGSGLTPQKDYRRSDGAIDTEAMRADGGVWLYTEYSLPEQAALEPGRYQVSVIHRILDDHVGEMNPLGTVAVCRQTFVLDTVPALAAIRETTAPTIAFAGAYPITVAEWGDQDVSYLTAERDLTGLTLTPKVQMRPTGVRVTLNYAFPADWDEATVDAVRAGLVYELIVDGVSAGEVFAEGSDLGMWLDIPMTASERAQCQSLLLRPSVEYIQTIRIGETAFDPAAGCRIPHGADTRMTKGTAPLEGYDIVIPLD